tara:strand:- start:510 stop:1754 length:1245 start_codon:yes stop_codon:yes gene_type:complete
MANLRALLDIAAEAEKEAAAKRKEEARRHEGWGGITAKLEGYRDGPAVAKKQKSDKQPLVVWEEYGADGRKNAPVTNFSAGPKGDGKDGSMGGRSLPKGQQPEQPMSQEDAVQAINHYMTIMRKSEAGRALIDMAEEMGVKFAIDQQAGVYGYYSPSENLVAVNPKVDDGRAIATLAHELRHAWQFKNGYHTKLDFSPADNIWMMRAMEADAEANSLRVAAELADAGHPEVLQSHAQSEYGDEAMAMVHMLQKDPEAIKNGKAQRAVFDQWFSKDWRRKAYDKHSIDYLEHFAFVLDDNRKTKGFTKIDTEWLQGLGQQPDGGNYLAPRKGEMDLDDDFYTGGVTAEVKERLDHLERRLDGKKNSGDEGTTYQFPNRRGRNGRSGPANDDGLPIAAQTGENPPRLVKAERRLGM